MAGPRQRVLTGDKELDRKLAKLGRKAKSIAGSGVRAGLKEISTSIKAQVPSKIRPAISHRLKKRKGGPVVDGKAGAGVGRRNKARPRPGRPGKGISKENIHWWVLGTGPRHTGSIKGRPTGFPRRYKGRMPAKGRGAVRRGTLQAKSRVLRVMQTAMWKRVTKEISKSGGR